MAYLGAAEAVREMQRIQRIVAALRPIHDDETPSAVSSADIPLPSSSPSSTVVVNTSAAALSAGELALPLNVTGDTNDNWPASLVPHGQEERHSFNEYLGGVRQMQSQFVSLSPASSSI